MNGRPVQRPATLSRLVANTEVPQRSVGIFWLGGPTVALKSNAGKVYLFDPGFQSDESGGPVGAIDVRPDLVVCTYHSPAHFSLPSLTTLSSAFPDTRFAGSDSARDWMTGRNGGEVTVNPGRVRAFVPGDTVDVRAMGVLDPVRIRILEDAGDRPAPWNVLVTLGGLKIALLREAASGDRMDRLCSALPKRVDVLIWSLPGEDPDRIGDGLQRLRPRYAMPIGHDRLPEGGALARRFRDAAASLSGTKAYLFPEDYREGLVYSRLMQRR